MAVPDSNSSNGRSGGDGELAAVGNHGKVGV